MLKIFPETLSLRHGLLCLEFTNTVFWRLRDDPIEGFTGYDIFIKWGRYIGLLTEIEFDRLAREAQAHPRKAASVLGRAIELREAIYRICLADIDNKPPDMQDLDLLNSELSKMLQHAALVHEGGSFGWGWKVSGTDLDQMFWPILQSTVELLTSQQMNKIGICEGEGCGWLFYDQSRNQSRKWCDMGDCGNRAKARRYYERKRKTKA